MKDQEETTRDLINKKTEEEQKAIHLIIFISCVTLMI